MASSDSDIKFTVMVQGPKEQFFEFSLPKDTDMSTLKLVIETQTNIESEAQQLYFNELFISSSAATLGSLGVEEHSVIVMKPAASNRIDLSMPSFSPMLDIPAMPKWLTMDSQELRQSIRSDGSLMQQLLHQNPTFAQV